MMAMQDKGQGHLAFVASFVIYTHPVNICFMHHIGCRLRGSEIHVLFQGGVPLKNCVIGAFNLCYIVLR